MKELHSPATFCRKNSKESVESRSQPNPNWNLLPGLKSNKLRAAQVIAELIFLNMFSYSCSRSFSRKYS